jgi:replicative DNA helicase
MDERNRLVARELSSVNSGGPRETFKLRLASGRQLEAKADCSLLALDGWRRLGGLEIGARVAIPRRVPQPLNTQRMVDDEVILLAHMIGDGSCIKRQPIRYASIDEENLRAVANAAKHFGVTAKRDDYAAARVTTLRLPAPYHLTHGKRNPIAAWLDGSACSISEATTSSCQRRFSPRRTIRSRCFCDICGPRMDAPCGTTSSDRLGSTTGRRVSG